jgi:diadenosine tetraphosphatase ApaH/serine/threonine PP2A family protein phosphatase
VIADLRAVGPDLVVQGGDLGGNGSRPADVIDRIRDLQWPGVQGNTDEMLWRPETLAAFAAQVPQLKPLMNIISEMAVACTAAIGPERLQWLSQLPQRWSDHGVTVVHAAPGDAWRAPMPGAPDADLLTTYGPLGTPRVVYGHIHVPFVRPLLTLTVANSGSVGLPYDGDPRAAYLLLDDNEVAIRRVEYNIEREVAELASRKLPHADWLAAMLRTGKYQPPATT